MIEKPKRPKGLAYEDNRGYWKVYADQMDEWLATEVLPVLIRYDIDRFYADTAFLIAQLEKQND